MSLLSEGRQAFSAILLLKDIFSHAFRCHTVSLLYIQACLIGQHPFSQSQNLSTEIISLADVFVDGIIEFIVRNYFVDQSILQGLTG